jgi:galactokinase
MLDKPAPISASAHGRVNLMGEHTDYNQGFVLPTPLANATTVTLSIAPEWPLSTIGHLQITSTHYPHSTIDRKLNESAASGHWSDYVLACCQQFQTATGIALPNLVIHLDSNVPMGAGVSSSAALEVAVLRALCVLRPENFCDDRTLARLAQQAENEGVGVPCGIMDQMVAALGIPNHAFFLDTRTLISENVSLPSGYQFVVIHSGVSHQLANSGYAQRRQECEQAAQMLGVTSLRDSDLAALETSQLPSLLAQRARHVLSENERVLKGVQCLKAGDMAAFGQLMIASHQSQKDDFAVTVAETDQLCQIALNHGAIGARQTGGGFGGAIVALINSELADDWWPQVQQDYPNGTLVATVSQ